MDGLRARPIQTRKIDRLSRRVIAANFVSDATRFFFERPSGEVRTIGAVAKILSDPLLEPAATFALRDVDEIVQNQFAIVPGVDADDKSMTKTHAARVFGQDAKAFRRLGQFQIFGKWNPIDHEDSHGGAVLDAGKFRIARVPGA